MTATKRQTAIQESRWAKARPHWEETRNPQQERFLTACAQDVDRVEQAIAEADARPARVAGFADLLARYAVATSAEATGIEQAQAPWLAWEIAQAAPHILADLRHAETEASEAHPHMVAAGQSARRAESRAVRAEDEVARLTAALDQANAALRDREVTQ